MLALIRPFQGPSLAISALLAGRGWPGVSCSAMPCHLRLSFINVRMLFNIESLVAGLSTGEWVCGYWKWRLDRDGVWYPVLSCCLGQETRDRGVLAGDQSTYERALGYTRPPMDDAIFTLRERLLAQR